jgi:hypothetical protein
MDRYGIFTELRATLGQYGALRERGNLGTIRQIGAAKHDAVSTRRGPKRQATDGAEV